MLSRRIYTIILFLVLGCFWAPYGRGQNLETIGKKDPLTLTGGFSINNVFYAAQGRTANRDPFMYVASANLNIDLYGWSVPLSFTYSNQQGQFRQPFNQYGMSPRYKWITGHVGYRSMTFSPYSLNGHIFLGGGVDLKPSDKFAISMMYGRLQKAVLPDTIQHTMPMYRRMGTGLKVKYTHQKNEFDLTLFRGWDEIRSLPSLDESFGVHPKDNMVIGFSGNTTFLQRFGFSIDVATSALTHDSRSETNYAQGHWMSKLPFLYQPNASSSFQHAIKSSLSYKNAIYSLAINYERIDPEYATLGSYYFNNDLENISLGLNTAIFKKRMNIAFNMGTQRNNLDQSKVSDMRRLLGSFNTSVAVNPQLNMGFSYSNFQTYTNFNQQFENINQLTPYENLDTLNYVQISQNGSFQFSYAPVGSSKDIRKRFNSTFSFQSSADTQGMDRPSASFYTGNLSYQLSFIPTGAVLNLAFNSNFSSGRDVNSIIGGPTLTWSRFFLDRKIRTTVSTSYNQAYVDGTKQKQVLNIRINNGYVINKHNFSLGLVLLSQHILQSELSRIREITMLMGYNYSF